VHRQGQWLDDFRVLSELVETPENLEKVLLLLAPKGEYDIEDVKNAREVQKMEICLKIISNKIFL